MVFTVLLKVTFYFKPYLRPFGDVFFLNFFFFLRGEIY